jgi:hypothetical protein
MGKDAGEAGKEKLKQFVRLPESGETAFDSGRFGGGSKRNHGSSTVLNLVIAFAIGQ